MATRLLSSSWRRLRSPFQVKFADVDVRVVTAFWLFGLVNNILYVIILSAALDLVGPSIPKATVLLASIIPGLATKVIVPYFIHLIPYSPRVLLFAALSTTGMLAVALSPTTTDASSISAKIAGIVLANISSGAGEVNFLALTHYYGPFSLAAWGSGTGGAGLIGAGAYALATTELGISVHATLLTSALLPVVMLLSFFALLPREPLKAARGKETAYQPLPTSNHPDADADADADDETPDTANLLAQPNTSTAYAPRQNTSLFTDLAHKLHRARALLLPYMLPLFLVYLAEYTINTGVAPTLLFPLPTTPFAHYRSFYPTYAALYQLGVFISRSSLAFFRVRALYTPAILQLLNLVVLIAQALWPFLPSVWWVFGLVFWEGLLGGLVYVSTYAAVGEEVEVGEREFSLGAVTVSDSAGIFVAGLVGVGLEGFLCGWQVQRGRGWCREL